MGCFHSPYRTFSGSLGGVRSSLTVDAHNLRPYFNSVMLCANETAWDVGNDSSPSELARHLHTLDLSGMENDLRGFSDVLRVGRYAYLTPLNSADRDYSHKLVRIALGDVDIGTTLQALNATGRGVRHVLDVLDLSKISPALKGYSGMFTAGKYLFLVPFRNAYEPTNGQRGHGMLTRLNMNDFSAGGVDFIDLTVTTRNQIPSFADVNLRGFSFGFASKSLSFPPSKGRQITTHCSLTAQAATTACWCRSTTRCSAGRWRASRRWARP